MKRLEKFPEIKLDRKAPYPIYRQLADLLRQEIKNGRWEENEALPEGRELSRKLNLNRITLRKSLDLLEEEGYLYKIKGSGVFVKRIAEPDTSYPNMGNKQIIGICMPQTIEHHASAVMQNASIEALHNRNYEVIRLLYYSPEVRRESVEFYREMLSGIILSAFFAHGVDDILKFLKTQSITPVIIGRNYYDSGYDFVGMQEKEGALAASEYLGRRGHSRVAIAIPRISSRDMLRLDGFKEGLDKHGCSYEIVHFHVDNTFRDENPILLAGRRIGKKILAARKPFTGVLCGNDLTAVGVYLEMIENGVSVPDDIEIIGYGDDEEMHALFPGKSYTLSTVRIPRKRIGRKAAELVCNRIENPGIPVQQLLLPTKLIHRKTTAGS